MIMIMTVGKNWKRVDMLHVSNVGMTVRKGHYAASAGTEIGPTYVSLKRDMIYESRII